MQRFGLRDDQWERIKDFLPGREGHVGGNAADNRIVDAVLYTEVLSDGLLGSFGQTVDNSSNSLLPAAGSAGEWTLSTFSHPFALPQPKPHLYDPVAALDAYCRQIRNKCVAECSNTALPSGDYGFLFWNCVNKCMQRYGCPTVRG